MPLRGTSDGPQARYREHQSNVSFSGRAPGHGTAFIIVWNHMTKGAIDAMRGQLSAKLASIECPARRRDPAPWSLASQRLIPVIVMPSMKYFWNAKKRITTGSMTTRLAAIIQSQQGSPPAACWNVVSPSCKVYLLSVLR